jgi:biotin transport system substrate-specific component
MKGSKMEEIHMQITKTIGIFYRIPKVLREILISVLGAALLTLLSQVSLPLPFTPIPLTLQTLAVFLLGGLLGRRLAAYSVLAYLMEGSLCLPVFAGGAVQPLWFLGPKAGFLLSFLPAAYLIGAVVENRPSLSLFSIMLSMAAGQCVISGIGMLWLSFYVGLPQAFWLGVFPFLSGAAIKIGIASLSIRGFHLCRGRQS